nr:MAG TPA: Lower collar protein [Caudoviricetes sp.]
MGSLSVDEIISKSWDKIFTTKVKFFDEDYRKIICSKILKHFYLREIGAETFGIWQLWMNTKLEEIMPLYNQMYESCNLKFNPFFDVDLTREHKGKGNTVSNGDNRTVNNTTVNANSVTQNNGVNRDLYSDTPQGALTGVENETYLTNARKNIDENTTNINTNTNSVNNETNTNKTEANTTDEYIETIVGKQGSKDYSALLKEYRETFLNIDMMIIEEFNGLFLNLW